MARGTPTPPLACGLTGRRAARLCGLHPASVLLLPAAVLDLVPVLHSCRGTTSSAQQIRYESISIFKFYFE